MKKKIKKKTEACKVDKVKYPIYLANFCKGDVRETDSMFKAKNMPDHTKWQKREIIKIDFKDAHSGTIQLEGKWTDAYFQGEYWLLEIIKPVNTARTKFDYLIVKEIWKNVLPKIVSITGILCKTNNKKVLLENIDTVEAQADINDELHFFDLQAESSDEETQDLIPLKRLSEVEVRIGQIFEGNEDYKIYLPVNLNPNNWKYEMRVTGSTIKYEQIKSWKTDLIKEIKDFFKDIAVKIGPVTRLENLNLTGLYAHFNKKEFFTLYKKDATRMLGDSGTSFSMDLSNSFNITDIVPISSVNSKGFKSIVKVANTFYDPTKRWDIFDAGTSEVKESITGQRGNDEGIVWNIKLNPTSQKEEIDFFILKGGKQIQNFYTPKERIVSSQEQINKAVDAFISEWKELVKKSGTVNAWFPKDRYRREGSWTPYSSFEWPKDSYGTYIKPDRVSWSQMPGGECLIALHFENTHPEFGTPHLWFPGLATLSHTYSTWEEIRKFKEKYPGHVYKSAEETRLGGYFETSYHATKFIDKDDAEGSVNHLFEKTAKNITDYEKIFKPKLSWEGWTNDPNGELEKLLIRGVEILNDDETSTKYVNEDPLFFWPDLSDGSIYTFQLKGTPFVLVYRGGSIKSMELLILDDSLIQKNTYSNFSIKKTENISLSVVQRINQKNSIFCFNEDIPIKHKIFTEINPEDIPLPELSVYYLNSDFSSPYDNYEVSYKSPVQHLTHRVKKLRIQEITQVYDAEKLSSLKIQQETLREQQLVREQTALARLKRRRALLTHSKNSFMVDASFHKYNVLLNLTSAVQSAAGGFVAGAMSGVGSGSGAAVGAAIGIAKAATSTKMQSAQLALRAQDIALRSEMIEQHMKSRTASVYIDHRREEEEIFLNLQEQFNKYEVPKFDEIEQIRHYLARIGKRPIHWILSVPNKHISRSYLEPLLHNFGANCLVNNFTLYPNFEGLYIFSNIDYIELKPGCKLDCHEREALENFLLNGVNIVEYDWDNEEIISDDKFFEKPAPLKNLELEIIQTRNEADVKNREEVERIKTIETTFIEVTKEQEAKLKEIRDNLEAASEKVEEKDKEVQRLRLEVEAASEKAEGKDKEVERLRLEVEAKNAETQRLNELSVQEQGEIATLTTQLQEAKENLKKVRQQYNTQNMTVIALTAQVNAKDSKITILNEKISTLGERNWHYWKTLHALYLTFFRATSSEEGWYKMPVFIKGSIKKQVDGNQIRLEVPPVFVSRFKWTDIDSNTKIDLYLLATLFNFSSITSPFDVASSVRYSSSQRHLNTALRITIRKDEMKNGVTKSFTINENAVLSTATTNSLKTLNIDWKTPWGKKIHDVTKHADLYTDKRNAYNAGKEWYED